MWHWWLETFETPGHLANFSSKWVCFSSEMGTVGGEGQDNCNCFSVWVWWGSSTSSSDRSWKSSQKSIIFLLLSGKSHEPLTVYIYIYDFIYVCNISNIYIFIGCRYWWYTITNVKAGLPSWHSSWLSGYQAVIPIDLYCVLHDLSGCSSKTDGLIRQTYDTPPWIASVVCWDILLSAWGFTHCSPRRMQGPYTNTALLEVPQADLSPHPLYETWSFLDVNPWVEETYRGFAS